MKRSGVLGGTGDSAGQLGCDPRTVCSPSPAAEQAALQQPTGAAMWQRTAAAKGISNYKKQPPEHRTWIKTHWLLIWPLIRCHTEKIIFSKTSNDQA